MGPSQAWVLGETRERGTVLPVGVSKLDRRADRDTRKDKSLLSSLSTGSPRGWIWRARTVQTRFTSMQNTDDLARTTCDSPHIWLCQFWPEKPAWIQSDLSEEVLLGFHRTSVLKRGPEWRGEPHLWSGFSVPGTHTHTSLEEGRHVPFYCNLHIYNQFYFSNWKKNLRTRKGL